MGLGFDKIGFKVRGLIIQIVINIFLFFLNMILLN